MCAALERPKKRAKLLGDDEDGDSSSDTSGGVPLNGDGPEAELKINKEFARRFEHNSRRAELHRLEEKYGKEAASKHMAPDNDEESEEDSSTSEEEDDDGVLALGPLDDELNATLKAIRSKDPRVYDTKAVFYTDVDDDRQVAELQHKKEKPVYLHDYHRENLLRGVVSVDEEEEEPTYVEQQAQLKNSVIKEMHAAAEAGSESDADNDDFLVAKSKPSKPDAQDQRSKTILTAAEVEAADADPDTFLSKFFGSKAWVQEADTGLHPFESDDEAEEERAEVIEEAYNFRFEDPSKANEHLVSHARDVVAKHSVRNERSTRRQRARETEADRKTAEKQERKAEKARLRRLKIEEAQQKLARIKDAAGTKGDSLNVDDWQDLLANDWDEAQWEAEMKDKFNDAYYAEHNDGEGDEESSNRKDPSKPKWDDDIDITDIVPNFDQEEQTQFSLSSDDSDRELRRTEPEPVKGKKKAKEEMRSQKRKELRQIEQLVDAKLDIDLAINSGDKAERATAFKYRDTSPISFGMNSTDILLADDSQLNQFAGLKKLATFRDPDKKRRDKKRLGKKARLREWRKETFGSQRGSRKTLQDFLQEELGNAEQPNAVDADRRNSKGKKRKRSTVPKI